MPTYEYQCPKGHSFEVLQKMSDEPVAKCPDCGAPAERKISGGAGFLFRGEGFYITDYRSDDYKKKAAKESGESIAGGAGAGGSKEGSSKEGAAKESTAKESTPKTSGPPSKPASDA